MLAALTKKKWFGWVTCALLTALTGMMLMVFAPGQPLKELSYDLPYTFRPLVKITNIVVVYVDPNSIKLLEQPGWPIDRRIYGDLVKRLKEAGARMILFDIVFRAPHPEADPQFAQALRSHGNVVLGGLFDLTRHQAAENMGMAMGQASPPVPLLRTNARAWALLAARPLDYSFAARRILISLNDMDSLAWAAAKLDGAPITRQPAPPDRELWLNYYGPARSLSGVSLYQALEQQGVPPGLFQNAVIFVGPHPSLSPQTGERDVFRSPYSRITTGSDASEMAGVEMHATAYANLVRGDWLVRISTGAQLLIAILWAVVLSFGLHWLSVKRAIPAALAAAAALFLFSCYLQIYQNCWWTWFVPVVVQTALALGLTISYRYLVESRQRKHLYDAFSAYVTPEVTEQIISRGIDLAPGGHESFVTIMFTDVEGFTDLSERVTPHELSQLLTRYFDDVTNCVLAEQGTVIKFIGDSVLAVWGAPVPFPDHAQRAVRAALAISKLSQKNYFGHRMFTRIGINTGNALVGNLGSRRRFDYTVIGAHVNYASRLESVNKQLKTSLLISESTRQLLDATFKIRCLGRFLLKGTAEAQLVHEVLALPSAPQSPPAWFETFAQALVAFQTRDLPAAKALFEQVGKSRDGSDGPSEFYLEYLANLAKDMPAAKWTDAITMTDK